MLSNFSKMLVVTGFAVASFGCAVSAQSNQANQNQARPMSNVPAQKQISIATDSPTATVITFYAAMRERRFRDALMMTNLRSAVADLTAADMQELAPDFEPMAAQTPAKIETKGEQISSNMASVFVQINNPLTGEMQLDEIKFRRENNAWTILTGDDANEKTAKDQGRNYFFNLRMETRHADLEMTLQDIIKAQMKYSLINKGAFADLRTLAQQRLIPDEFLDERIMGYRIRMNLAADKKRYTVNAEPVAYGKTGKLSFLLESTTKNSNPSIKKDDKNGSPLN